MPATAAPHSNADQTFGGDVATRSILLGDMLGLRTFLAMYGVTLNLFETSEVLGNVSGGVRRGANYAGLTTGSLEVDSRAAFGYGGGTFKVSAEQIHGRNFSAETLLNLQTASGIEADRATRLWELWYDQKFLGGRLDIKAGQQSLDTEFIVSTNALLFLNTVYGWPLVPSDDLPGGGPAYPLSALGVRLRAQVAPAVTVLAGVSNGSPARKDCVGDAQMCNPSGTSFPLDGDQLVIGELQYAFPADGNVVKPGHGLLPGTYKVGFWVDAERFADQRYDVSGLPLAPLINNTGDALQHQDNWSIYGVADQMLWQQDGGGKSSLNAFVRAMGSPSDRNLVSFGLNAGLVWRAPLAGRDDDSAGLALSYGKISAEARGFDRDVQRATGSGFARSDETSIEATYQYVPFAWWQIQPDFQYTFNTGGGIENPYDPGRKIRNEAVFGLRTNIIF